MRDRIFVSEPHRLSIFSFLCQTSSNIRLTSTCKASVLSPLTSTCKPTVLSPLTFFLYSLLGMSCVPQLLFLLGSLPNLIPKG